MAARLSKAIQPTNATDAHFRAWTRFIHEALLAGGWEQTADTGQIDFDTVSAPNAANQKRGYAIYESNDSVVHATPFVMRLDFGSAGAAANMAVWLTVGPSSDGSGTINTPWIDGSTGNALFQAQSNSSSVVHPRSYVSAGLGRLHVAIGASVSNAPFFGFSVERAVTASGQVSAEGFVLNYPSGGGQTWARTAFVLPAVVPQPPVNQDFAVVLPTTNPSVITTEVAASLPLPFVGVTKQPGLGVLVTRSLDFQAQAVAMVEVYGALIRYVRLPGANGGPNTGLWLRFD